MEKEQQIAVEMGGALNKGLFGSCFFETNNSLSDWTKYCNLLNTRQFFKPSRWEPHFLLWMEWKYCEGTVKSEPISDRRLHCHCAGIFNISSLQCHCWRTGKPFSQLTALSYTYLSAKYIVLFVLLQVLDLFNLEQLAEIAALSLSPGESKDDPVLQLTQLQKEKEIVWGKKTDRLKRKSQKYKWKNSKLTLLYKCLIYFIHVVKSLLLSIMATWSFFLHVETYMYWIHNILWGAHVNWEPDARSIKVFFFYTT